jgi:hypothetical protein
MEGWLKLHRKVIYWGWFHEPDTLKTFLYLLAMANHKDSIYYGESLKRGQLLTGRHSLSKELKLSEQTVRTTLKRLEKTGEISIKSTSQNSIITICKYDIYQGPDFDSQPTTNQRSTNDQPTANQRLTNDQPTINQRLTNDQPTTNHIQECNNEKNEKNERMKEEYLSVDSGESTTNETTKTAKVQSQNDKFDEEFEVFWKQLLSVNRAGDSKKVARQRFRAVRKLHPLADVFTGVKHWEETNISRDPEYRKGLSSWLYSENIEQVLAGHAVKPVAKKTELQKTFDMIDRRYNRNDEEEESEAETTQRIYKLMGGKF